MLLTLIEMINQIIHLSLTVVLLRWSTRCSTDKSLTLTRRLKVSPASWSGSHMLHWSWLNMVSPDPLHLFMGFLSWWHIRWHWIILLLHTTCCHVGFKVSWSFADLSTTGTNQTHHLGSSKGLVILITVFTILKESFFLLLLDKSWPLALVSATGNSSQLITNK